MRDNHSVAIEQPVRFYKFVAVGFLFLTLILFGVIIFMSSKRAVVTIVTAKKQVEISPQVRVGSLDSGADIFGTVTTTVVEMTKTYSPTGSKQEDGISKGVVTLYNDSGVSQPLVEKTRLLSPDEVLFRLEEGVTVPANGSIEANVYADLAGKNSDIAPTEFTIPGLNESRQKEVYAKSTTSMSGGVKTIGVLSSEDIKRAEMEMKEELKQKAEMTLFDKDTEDYFYHFDVVQDSFEHTGEIGEEVDGFDLTGKITIFGIETEKEDIQEFAENALMKFVFSQEQMVEKSSSEPQLTFDMYDDEKGYAKMTIFYDGYTTLNPEASSIEKKMLLGKSEDEVRRYLFGIDNVSEVEVKLKPAWIRTVPFMEEHVTVVVKNVN